jgi:hypothetical protein
MGKARLNPDRVSIWRLTGGHVLIVAIIVLLAAHAWDYNYCTPCMLYRYHPHGCGQWLPISALKTITSAQADFRANDRDGDGMNQFWRADIAGLYTLAPGGGPAIRLIEQSLALADAQPTVDLTSEGQLAPYSGYWFRALRHTDETEVDGLRFAAVAYPASYLRTGRFTYIVDENNTILRADLGHGKGLDVYPTSAELKAQWSKLD